MFPRIIDSEIVSEQQFAELMATLQREGRYRLYGMARIPYIYQQKENDVLRRFYNRF